VRRIEWTLTISLMSAGWTGTAEAICREVEETGSEPPIIRPDQELLVIKRTGVEVGCEEPPAPDAGPPADAGPSPDAAACEPRTGNTITWVVQPRFSTGASGARFALLMVTPGPPIIETAPAGIFEELARATAPIETVENVYVEDPSLGYQCQDPKGGTAGCGSSYTTGGDGDFGAPDFGDGDIADAGLPSGYVPVQMVGDYQVVVLAAQSGTELAAWLDQNGYQYGADDIAALEPYIALGWVVDDGGLEPLAFSFEGDEIRLPLAVSRQTSGRALLRVYLAAEGRYELDGAGLTYAGLTTPMAQERAYFLTANLLDRDLTLPAEEDPVAERAAVDEPFQESYTRTITTRVPSSECPSRNRDYGGSLCACRLGTGSGGTLASVLLGCAAAAFVLRRRRRGSS
jgi:hypothetical protein